MNVQRTLDSGFKIQTEFYKFTNTNLMITGSTGHKKVRKKTESLSTGNFMSLNKFKMKRKKNVFKVVVI